MRQVVFECIEMQEISAIVASDVNRLILYQSAGASGGALSKLRQTLLRLTVTAA
jgi:hypothetical protein